MTTKLDKFKATISANEAKGMSERQAIYTAITNDLAAYVEMLKSCRLTDAEIVDCFKQYAVPETIQEGEK